MKTTARKAFNDWILITTGGGHTYYQISHIQSVAQQHSGHGARICFSNTEGDAFFSDLSPEEIMQAITSVGRYGRYGGRWRPQV